MAKLNFDQAYVAYLCKAPGLVRSRDVAAAAFDRKLYRVEYWADGLSGRYIGPAYLQKYEAQTAAAEFKREYPAAIVEVAQIRFGELLD